MAKKNKQPKVVKKKLTRTVLKKSTAMFLKIIFLVFLSFVSLYLILISVENQSVGRQELISISKQNSVKYSVSLKPNKYYEEKILKMNGRYLSDIVDKVIIDFAHSSSANKKYNYNYKTREVATMYIYEKGSEVGQKELWKKEFPLSESNLVFGLNQQTYNTNKKVELNYAIFDNVVKSFQEDYSLSVGGYVKVTQYITSSNTVEGYGLPLASSEEMSVNIPLNERVFAISTDYEAQRVEKVHRTVAEEKSIQDTVFLAIGIFGIISSILLIMSEVIIYIKEEKEESIYLTTLNKILASYGDIIVKAQNKIDLKGMTIIDVESIEELIDAQNELRIPIAYFEITENEKCAFVIVNQNQAWRYQLSSKNLEKELEENK